MGCDSQIPIVPVSGFLDKRSTVDEVPFGGYRRADNVEVTTKRRLCRGRGWRKYRDQPDYNNQDLHDQLSTPRQPFHLLHQVTTNAGFTHTFAATKNRIYVEVPATGNWRIISDALGGEGEADCSEMVWSAGAIGQTVVFSNNVDAPVYHTIGQPPLDGEQSVDIIEDLALLNVTKVGLVVSWNNLMFYMDVEMDGARVRNRILWSDYKRPLSVFPDPGVSLAGSSDLQGDEIILAAKPMADVLLVYTTRGIYEGRVSSSEAAVAFRRRYDGGDTGSRCLAYKRTLVSTGDEHYYVGRDGIYRYTLYSQKPELVEYIHRASAAIFDDINSAACNAHCGAYFSQRKQVWFSWAQAGQTCPTRTLVIGTEFPFCSEIDAGFTAFASTEPHINLIIRDFIREQCICTSEELETFGFGFIKEGGYCTPQEDPACPERPQSFHSQTPRAEADIGVTTEQWDGPEDDDSFAGMFPDLTVEELCGAEFLAGGCNADQVFLMASSTDNCLKEAAEVYYRERVTDRTGCGTYSKDGYKSLMTSGALHFNTPDREKVATCFQIEGHPLPAAVPGQVVLRIGVAAQAIDPLEAGGRCIIFWEQQDPRRLECLSELTLEESQKEGTAPMETFAWPLNAPGRYLYYELEISNPHVTPADTGAAVCISRYDLFAHQMGKC